MARTSQFARELDRTNYDQGLAIVTAILELFGTRQVAAQKWCKRRSRTFSHLSRNVKHTRAVLTDPGWYRGSMGGSQEYRFEVRADGLGARRNPRRGKGVNQYISNLRSPTDVRILYSFSF